MIFCYECLSVMVRVRKLARWNVYLFIGSCQTGFRSARPSFGLVVCFGFFSFHIRLTFITQTLEKVTHTHTCVHWRPCLRYSSAVERRATTLWKEVQWGFFPHSVFRLQPLCFSTCQSLTVQSLHQRSSAAAARPPTGRPTGGALSDPCLH